MSNTIYIDANRANSTSGRTTTNEWTYKLNTELLLPKGTNIQIQNSFINKQGITGGSIEIEHDINEIITYYHYITESPQWTPLADQVDNDNNWYRGTLNITPENFRNNFTKTAPDNSLLIGDSEIDQIMLDFDMTTQDLIKSSHYDYFRAYGGSSMILPRCKIKKHTDNNAYVIPDVKTLNIRIPKGVYGIGQLAELIEDQINGLSYVENGELIKKDTNTKLMENNNGWEGQPSNTPCLDLVDLKPRSFNNLQQEPFDIDGTDGDIFLNQKDFNDLMNYVSTTDSTLGQTEWKYSEYRNSHAIYCLTTNYDDGSRGGTADPDITLTQYSLYNYDDYIEKPAVINRLIGTTNFGISYDTVKNGFVINGLHNVPRQSSHDRFGNKMANAGQTSIFLKKEAEKGRIRTNTTETVFKQIRNLINRPLTRDMGIAIINFGYKTCIDENTNNVGLENGRFQRFGEFFDTENERIDAWEKTIWSRLGFTYNQIANHNKFNTQDIYNKHSNVPEYGFTTNAPLDVSMIPTISTESNPLIYTTAPPDGSAGVLTEGVIMSNTNGFAKAIDRYNAVNFNMYSNSLLTTTTMAPIVLDNVGGIIAENLPILSKHGYYLITSDILDNFKDNVKKGDVLPLLGVVPKSSESNQDYIVSNNQIVQVLTQDKVLNKIKIKILNPDLTNPELNGNSSVIMKITMPYITPISLLPPKEQKEVLQSENS